MIRLGATIKKFRQSAELRQVDLARKLGIESTYLSAVENDKRLPSFALLRQICTALRIPPEVMFWDAVEPDIKVTRRDRKIIEAAKAVLKHYYPIPKGA